MKCRRDSKAFTVFPICHVSDFASIYKIIPTHPISTLRTRRTKIQKSSRCIATLGEERWQGQKAQANCTFLKWIIESLILLKAANTLKILVRQYYRPQILKMNSGHQCFIYEWCDSLTIKYLTNSSIKANFNDFI